MRIRYFAQFGTSSCRAGRCEGVTESDVPFCGLAEPLLHQPLSRAQLSRCVLIASLSPPISFSKAQLS